MTGKIKGLLFDKDGVLFDFQKTWGGWAADMLSGLAKGDAGLYRALGERVGFDTDTQLFASDSEVIAGTPEDGVRLLLPLLPDWDFDGLLAHSNAKAAEAPLVETVPLAPLMRDLRAIGLRIGVATNDAESSARAHLRSVGAEGAFDMIMGSDSGFGPKPAPGMCHGFLDAFDLAPTQTIMIGDSTHDLEAGHAAGMMTIGVLTGPASAAELRAANHLLPDISHLPSLLPQL